VGWPHDKRRRILVLQKSKWEMSEEEGPWGILEVDGRMLFWGIP